MGQRNAAYTQREERNSATAIALTGVELHLFRVIPPFFLEVHVRNPEKVEGKKAEAAAVSSHKY
jgi:hypothetical protein